MLVPYAAGGLTDVVARHYAEQLRKSLGQNLVVENKPGASGIIAIEEMARAKPDGYTIMIGNISTNALTPVLLAKKMRIDYDRDVQIVARLADAPVFFMATTTNFPPKTFAEFLAYAKAHPGDVRYASAGIGAYQHVNTEILSKRAGLEAAAHSVQGRRRRHPAGRRQRRHPCVVVQHHQSGRHDQGRQGPPARGRGARSGWRTGRTCRRSTEVGFPGFRASQWSAAFAPAGVPREIIETLHKAFVAADEHAGNAGDLREGRHGGAVAEVGRRCADLAQGRDGDLAARYRGGRDQGG